MFDPIRFQLPLDCSRRPALAHISLAEITFPFLARAAPEGKAGFWNFSGMTAAQKAQLRHAARERRRALADPDFAAAIARHAEVLTVAPGAIVGGYHALPDEADPALLLERLVELGAHIAFPRVAGKAMPLDYHRVPDGEMLSPGKFAIHEPSQHWPRATPAILLVPLLAFDARGHRLGYGGGFYDRTLQALNVPAIGIAYAGQQIASLPAEAHDRRLNAILTEHGLTRFS